jgi:hypothetical protein
MPHKRRHPEVQRLDVRGLGDSVNQCDMGLGLRYSLIAIVKHARSLGLVNSVNERDLDLLNS